jgi:uncharacterized membrane protein
VTRADFSRYTITAIVGFSGVLHFAAPAGYRQLVPRTLGHEKEIVAVSGVAELACAAAMTYPKTRRLGGWLTAALLVAVFPANIKAAFEGGMSMLPPPWNSPLVAWARLPFQLPMIMAAVGVGLGDETKEDYLGEI